LVKGALGFPRNLVLIHNVALWKNAQKIATKNKASDTINKATPIFIPRWTELVWSPK